MSSAVELMDAGFACLVERLGVVDAERFVAMIKRDSFSPYAFPAFQGKIFHDKQVVCQNLMRTACFYGILNKAYAR